MRVGIVGFRGAGKSTVFNALTGVGARGRKKSSRPRQGVMKVPDFRVEELGGILNRAKTNHAEITLVDFTPGKGDRALNPKIFAQLRQVDALTHVVKWFPASSDQAALSPLTAIQDFESELKLTDLVAVEQRLTELKKAKGLPLETNLLERCKAQLEEDRPLRRLSFNVEDRSALASFGFLSQKPLLLALNLGQEEAARPLPKVMRQHLKKEGFLAVPLSGKVELELAELEETERLKHLKELGLKEPFSQRFVRTCYSLMDLITFLTYDEEEVRAWSVKRGTSAGTAAAEVQCKKKLEFHDVEVVQYKDLLKYGSEQKCREAGKFRLAGKEYIVQEGNVLRFHFNE